MPVPLRLPALLLAAVCFALPGLTSCRSRPNPAPRLAVPAAAALPYALPLLIPQPKSVRLTGTRLRLTQDTRLVLDPATGPLDRMAALSVQAELHERLGLPMPPIGGGRSGKDMGGVEIVFGEPSRSLLLARWLREAGAKPCAKAEGYVLLVGPHRIVVAGHDPHGTFYGAQTLCQMLDRDTGGVYAWGGCIDDYPSLAWRGAHLFTGGHALPFHEKLIARVFARLKMNNLVLQCEQAKWDTLGKAAPPWAMSKTDLKSDIRFARSYGMTVTPLVNSAGHMPWLFQDPANLPLAEDPQTPYAANVSNPETYRRLFRLYDEVEDTFHSDSLHVGGDEVTLRGRFPCRSRSKYPTVAAAFVAHITRLHDHLRAKGVRTMLWADMLLAPGDALDATSAPTQGQAAQMRARLPHDIILTDWHYSARASFTSPLLLRRSGFGSVIGGTWAVPGNIIGFSRALTTQGQGGLLETTWAGYNSSEANLVHDRYQFAAFVLAADCAWNGGRVDVRHLRYDPAKVFDRLYGRGGRGLGYTACMTTSTLTPPIAQTSPKTDTLHGDSRIDNYFWMREKSNPEVIAYLEAENTYADSILAPTKELQETLYSEMKGRIQETDLSVPYRLGEYFYYSRTEEGKQYPIRCRKHGSLEAAEEITLDLNVLAEGHSYLGLGAYAVSDDGALLAFSTDITGFRQYTLQVKDLRTGEMLPDKIEKTVSVVWAADNKTLFYTVEDDAKRSYRLYRHQLGIVDDTLIYEETDQLFGISARRSRSKAFLFLTSESSKTTEVRYLDSRRPDGEWSLYRPRETDHRYYADHHGDKLFVRTDKDAKNFRIVSAPLDAPNDWTEFIPHDPAITREDMDFFTAHAVISEREGGLEQLRVVEMSTETYHKITFPEPSYAVSLDANPEYDTAVIRYRYQSQITPASVFDYDMNAQTRTLLKQTPVLGGYDPSLYVAERLEATASDGTRVPISLVYKKGLEKNGTAPLLLYGYGSYGISMPAGFSSNRLSLLDRGIVFAIAHIRGGGEMGEDWREAGKLHVKKNTFTDFIACAEFLIAEKYTSPEHLAIQGGSAGGLLMGATINLRPDLFQAVLSQVPFVDVLNTMLDDTLPLTVGEYLEWGNPNVKDDYNYMKTYCPYTNLEAKAYPNMLVKTSLNDSQVMYWEAAKYTAKLRTHKTDTNTLLLKTNMGAGHGGSSGRYDALRETAFDYAFLLTQLSVA